MLLTYSTYAWIGYKSIRQRWFSSMLTMISMALGVALSVAVLLVHGVIADSFRNSSNLGYNIIIGKKGSELQLVLNSVYYLDRPIENIPYSYYQEFLSAEELADQLYLGNDPALRQEVLQSGGGKYSSYVLRAIPICMGDYLHRFRVVGTTPAFFEPHKDAEGEMPRKYVFSEGRNFKVWDDEHQFFEGVVGATVAREVGLKVGDTFNPTHGSAEGHPHSPFTVVGVLKPTGTPVDSGVFINMEGFFLMEGHAKPPPKDPNEPDLAAPRKPEPKQPELTPLPLIKRQVTAILLRTDIYSSPMLTKMVNDGDVAQAALPVRVIHSLFKSFVDPIQQTLLALTLLICVVSGMSILVAIYNSMSERAREIAIMRALGANRETIGSVVLVESTMLALGGGLLGWIGARVVILALNPMIEETTGVSVNVFRLAPSLWADSSIALVAWLPSELLLLVALILLAILVGSLPAYRAAYETDVSKSLQG